MPIAITRSLGSMKNNVAPKPIQNASPPDPGVSEKYGRNVWKGVVRGLDIEGTFVHYPKGWMLNPNPAPIEHWFKGKVKS